MIIHVTEYDETELPKQDEVFKKLLAILYTLTKSKGKYQAFISDVSKEKNTIEIKILENG